MFTRTSWRVLAAAGLTSAMEGPDWGDLAPALTIADRNDIIAEALRTLHPAHLKTFMSCLML